MSRVPRWPRVVVIAGLCCMVIGAIDPLEGSVVILAGLILATVGTVLAKSPHRALMCWALGLAVVGIGILFGFSMVGGIGGTTGLSQWWGVALLPYPVGWIAGLVAAVRFLRAPAA